MNEAQIHVLLTCPLFENMQSDDLSHLLACFQPRISNYLKGEYVSLEGDPQDAVGILLSGRLSVNRETVTGNKMVMAVLSPGELFGEMAAFSGRKRWPASVLVLEPSEVIFIPISRFSYTCSNTCPGHTQLIRNMLGIISSKALMLNRKVEYLTIKGMREKLCRYLVEQSRTNGSTMFTMDMNRNELADFLNVSRPSMSRELGRMRDEGLIDFYRGSVRILSLEQLTQFCPDAV